jgi:hypothetical protein
MVKTELPETKPDAAVIVVVPAATPVASPPDAIVATCVLDDFHLTEDVMFCELPSL